MQIGGYLIPRRVIVGLGVVVLLLLFGVVKLTSGSSGPSAPLHQTPATVSTADSLSAGELSGRVLVSHCQGTEQPSCWSPPKRPVSLTVSGPGRDRHLTVRARFTLKLSPGRYRVAGRSAEGRGQVVVDLLPGLGQGTLLVLR